MVGNMCLKPMYMYTYKPVDMVYFITMSYTYGSLFIEQGNSIVDVRCINLTLE